MSYTTPYVVFENECGTYDPDKPHDPPFSVWMGARKQEYLALFPESVKNQIDGHFYSDELTRFFHWISDRRKP